MKQGGEEDSASIDAEIEAATGSGLWQIVDGIALHALIANLEVQVRAGAAPRGTNHGDLLATGDIFTLLYKNATQVGV